MMSGGFHWTAPREEMRKKGARRHTLREKGLDRRRPLAPEEVGTGQTSVSSTNDQAVDALLDKMQSGELSPFGRSD